VNTYGMIAINVSRYVIDTHGRIAMNTYVHKY